MRPLGATTGESGQLFQRPWIESYPSTQPTSQPSTQPYPRSPVNFHADNFERIQSPDGYVAFTLEGHVQMTQRNSKNDLIELQAEHAVIFTKVRRMDELGANKKFKAIEDAVDAAYLEGDVRVELSPAAARKPEQRLFANRLYYEFGTDRAILTQAVVHTLEPERQIPVTIRADLVRQLSLGEYRAEHVELSSSQLATPTYSVRATHAYVRQVDTGDDRYGSRTQFVADNTTFRMFGFPFFYLPVTAGSFTDRGFPLRSIYVEENGRFGLSARSEWGFFESLGVLPPEDLDIGYRLDYFEKRGPGVGATAKYQGGYITDSNKEAWDFDGRITGYFVNDHGADRLGSARRVVTPDDNLRGRVLWEHQQFFPGDWQVQLRGGYASDPTFLQEYFQREFDTEQPAEASAYLKHQRDSEALTLLLEYPTNNFPTTSGELQEQVQVERYPELGYRRIGDSLGDDQLTFFSDNRAGLYHFKESGRTLNEEGFRAGQSPGIPSYGYTGTDDDTTGRADFRQEIDYPLTAGRFKVVPYVIGRYTGYTETPGGGGDEGRVFVGTGVKINTAFWRVDDSARSDLFDIHRIRHVIEPELNFFTSAETHDQNDFYIYDEQVDAINDVTAVQLALHQRWQTKRGGAGQFRSVDFFTFNIEANFFANQPSDSVLNPTGFRGLFFPSLPESSLARNSVNADALWRVSDTTAVLGDASYNLDEQQLATTSLGFAAQRDPRESYFVGARYIGQINSTIASVAASYVLSQKYTLAFSQSVNLSQRKNQDSSVTIIRHFDRLFVTLSLYYDAIDDTSGFRFGIIPEGLGAGVSSASLQTVFGPQ